MDAKGNQDVSSRLLVPNVKGSSNSAYIREMGHNKGHCVIIILSVHYYTTVFSYKHFSSTFFYRLAMIFTTIN